MYSVGRNEFFEMNIKMLRRYMRTILWYYDIDMPRALQICCFFKCFSPT